MERGLQSPSGMAHRQLTQAANTNFNDTLEAAWPGVAAAATEWWKTEPVEDTAAPESTRVRAEPDVLSWPSAAAAAGAWWDDEPAMPVRSVTEVRAVAADEVTAEWPEAAAAAGAWWHEEALRSGVYATRMLESDLAQVA